MVRDSDRRPASVSINGFFPSGDFTRTVAFWEDMVRSIAEFDTFLEQGQLDLVVVVADGGTVRVIIGDVRRG
ncbi:MULTISPECIES: hypothetical protein [Methylococcus]|uniref:Uncharacterized protein n=1 Tax=Methylococcus capsulatus TaxID=414 RepID=A0ABZ2F299_METCP|nr:MULTISPECIES: hypothetical protein [Methylococcus]